PAPSFSLSLHDALPISQQFSTRERRCNIALSRPAQLGETREIEIAYHGEPRRGIRFFPDQAQVYTVFATSQWLVCVDAPDDKATDRKSTRLNSSHEWIS